MDINLLQRGKVTTNLLLTERDGRTGKYWPEDVALRKMTERQYPQYGPEEVRSVSCLLYVIVSLSDRTLLRLVNVRNLPFP